MVFTTGSSQVSDEAMAIGGHIAKSIGNKTPGGGLIVGEGVKLLNSVAEWEKFVANYSDAELFIQITVEKNHGWIFDDWEYEYEMIVPVKPHLPDQKWPWSNAWIDARTAREHGIEVVNGLLEMEAQ